MTVPKVGTRKLLVLDTSYAWEAIRERSLQESVTCRDLGGFFEHVWTVHPFASLVEKGTSKIGRPELHAPAPAHTFINGKVGRFDALARLKMLNFGIGQSALFAELLALIRRERITAIRAGDPLWNGLFGLALARAARLPLIIRVNANYDESYRITGKSMMPRLFPWRPMEKAVFGYVLAHADLVAAVNDDNLKFAIANGAQPSKSTIFRYGNLIDKRHVAPPEGRDHSWSPLNEAWSERVPFLLTVGRLESVKLPDEAIRVFAEVRRHGRDVKLAMVGDGQERAALGALAASLDVAEHVHFFGNRDQDWLSKVIPMAAAVISPCTGRALTECAFGAAPIAAYDLDWQGELIVTGVTGEIRPAREAASLAEGVIRYLEDPSYARRMGDAVRRRAFEMLDPETLDQHERDEYTKLFERFFA